MQADQELTCNKFSYLKSSILIWVLNKAHMLPCHLVYHLSDNVMEKSLKLLFKHLCRELLTVLNS